MQTAPAAAPLARIASLELQTSRLEAASAVKRLQRAFGYYLDKALWDEAAELFSDDGTIEIALDGVYRGQDRIRQYFYALGGGRSGLTSGTMREWFQLQPVVSVAADGLTAKARWRAFILAGELGKHAFWGEGPYETEYVKQRGVWRFARLHWYQTFIVPYEGGWPRNRDATGGVFVSRTLAPDEPPSERYETWPGVHVPAFHYGSPVEVLPHVEPANAPEDGAAPRGDAATHALVQSIASLEQRLRQLHHVQQIENLISAYGYYLDKQQWEALAALFADDATMEISQRGVYVGRAHIRKALELFGPPGVEPNHLHNHQQLQPVIHVQADGRRAWARSRAFGQLGVFQSGGIWHGGVYENEFVNESGVWRFKRDHVYTTYFAPYEGGWMHGPRPAAKASDRIPPDQPPSEVYEAFPGVYIPPFHDPHPVTGQAIAREVHVADMRLTSVTRRLSRLEDERAIENLQRSYGYFVDKALWSQTADLFAENGTLEIGGRGVFVGRERALAYLRWLEPRGLTRGKLFEHLQLQPIVTVAPDGASAHGRWRFFAQVGDYQRSAIWGLGTYENEYVKENGVWKLQKLHSFFRMYSPYADGWGKTALPNTRPEKDLPPDRPPTLAHELYPSPFIPAYHYRNPVTGR